MLKFLTTSLAILAGPALAQDLHQAISCYQESANAKDINAYMAYFSEDAEMIDFSRTLNGQDAIRAWAERKVIPGGGFFRHREILEQADGKAAADCRRFQSRSPMVKPACKEQIVATQGFDSDDDEYRYQVMHQNNTLTYSGQIPEIRTFS